VIVTGDPGPLVAAVAAAGIDGEGSADLIAIDWTPSGVDAVFSRREHSGLPRYDENSLPELRLLVAA
jgi:hypothetical protein